jgi:hypothetical protein
LNENPASAIGAIALIPTAPTANAAMIANALNIFGITAGIWGIYLTSKHPVTMVYNVGGQVHRN